MGGFAPRVSFSAGHVERRLLLSGLGPVSRVIAAVLSPCRLQSWIITNERNKVVPANVDGITVLRGHDRRFSKLVQIDAVQPVQQSDTRPRHKSPQDPVYAMRRRSNPECDGPTGHQGVVPRGSRRLVVLGQGPSPRNESVRVRSPVASVLVEFSQNLVQTGDRSRLGRRSRACQRRRHEFARSDRLG